VKAVTRVFATDGNGCRSKLIWVSLVEIMFCVLEDFYERFSVGMGAQEKGRLETVALESIP
jgi:hypothetical protein